MVYRSGGNLIVTSQLELGSFSDEGESTSRETTDVMIQNGQQETVLWPRHVSKWCLSKRKRGFDLIVSLLALLLLWPLMLFIGCLIRLTSKGPALFRQERMGFNQQTFVIFKFRTMKHCVSKDEMGSQVTKQGDSRMTELGAVLRRLKVDELPQLINVARGEMSLVGPRPKIPEHENLGMASRPGITGAATIVFSHEESLLANIPEQLVEQYVRSVLNPEKCRLDAHYIETATFSTDLDLLARTLFKIGNSATSARGQMASTREHTETDTSRMDGIDATQDAHWLA
jgi:lipopolysaccharide/colanic/teichoic acid biosynthesis glycosyltransferase